MANEELYHYGVLGMKWGQRKAKKYQDKADRLRKNARGLTNSANLDRGTSRFAKASKNAAYKNARKQRAKADKYEAKAKEAANRGKGYSAAARRKIANTSTGKAVAQSLLLGSYGAAVYTNARTKNVSRGKAVALAMLGNTVNNLTLGSLSRRVER